ICLPLRGRHRYMFLIISPVYLTGAVQLFMPFGYFIYVLFKPMRSFLPYFFFFLFMIIGVEVIQYIWKVGSADIDDIILNMSGVLILYIVLKIPFIKKLF
ncbi:VanZ family protein, partial [Coprobacillus sp. K06]|uniref:VanZ family protein n=1 Tax=Coprobacillus sp. K06 TaxID=2718930 RepID=UPI001C8CE98B